MEPERKRMDNAGRAGMVLCFVLLMVDYFVLERSAATSVLFTGAALALLIGAITR
ncbi:hypothetical protein GRI97_08030 [Altererythrobacter xixiisoli]|uniref:Uncharacterized protein n=1 Tax=Croceibacterium xixiisoli TaxID=1476466 RepID=A0A6I4TST0_9SPHN|nr:hypothetical protein [Croceibacterium xixiisoli]MXO98934.1 hypothetical protein [Croceibacterium xixiisoli]